MSSQTAPLNNARAIWYQQDVSTAGWPIMNADSYYWVVVTPGSPLTITNGQYNGAIWQGIDSTYNPVPPITNSDPIVFSGRQLISERARGDSAFGSSAPASVNFLVSCCKGITGLLILSCVHAYFALLLCARLFLVERRELAFSHKCLDSIYQLEEHRLDY
jgi:hypothetical protein